jgi:hypothetical protein
MRPHGYAQELGTRSRADGDSRSAANKRWQEMRSKGQRVRDNSGGRFGVSDRSVPGAGAPLISRGGREESDIIVFRRIFVDDGPTS